MNDGKCIVSFDAVINGVPRSLTWLLLTVLFCGCTDSVSEMNLRETSRGSIPKMTRTANREPIRPLMAPAGVNDAKAQLGRALFHDVRLSKDNSISCASCHNVAEGGDDGLKTAVGIDNQVGVLNTPTVLNSGLLIAQFWDGRVDTLEQQVSGPVHNPIEMGSNWGEVIQKLKKDQALVKQFQKVYSDGVSEDAIIDAIAHYERALVTVNSPFDRYLKGETNAITDEAKKGYQLFKEIGCIACHQGQTIGGNMFQEFGVMDDYFADREQRVDADNGRFNVTKRDADLHRFKVPSLRNIVLTAPYFHNGEAATLKEAVETMAEYQLGTQLEESQIERLLAFLESLTGEIEEDLK